jgi:predicted NUDIX family phosphoesterase/fido (protein-threonine AMPylation protein)
LQLIPYVVLRNAAGKLWRYARSGGDARLEGRWSCGVGGHVDEIDAAANIRQTLDHTARREMAEELALEPGAQPALNAVALIYEGHSPIGRVHLGVLLIAEWAAADPPTPPPGEALSAIGFMSASTIAADPRFELWSRLAAEFIASPARGDNFFKEIHHAPATIPAIRATFEHLARTTSRRSQPAGSVSPADSQHDPQFDGSGTGASGRSPSATASDSTRPLDATRELDTAHGVLTYSEVSEHLALNIAHALEMLIDDNPERIEITPDWIRKIHHQLAGEFFPDWAGCFRSSEVQVGTHFPPPAYDVAVNIANYCLDLAARIPHANDGESIAALLAWADWRFQWIHPFKDFNGRVGRILLVALCFKLNLPPAIPAADDDSRTCYFNALRDADCGDFSTLNHLWMERLIT